MNVALNVAGDWFVWLALALGAGFMAVGGTILMTFLCTRIFDKTLAYLSFWFKGLRILIEAGHKLAQEKRDARL